MNTQTFFKDLKVVELASVLAGPAVGMFFAELGAKVLKIENPTTKGDTTRHWKMPSENPESPWSAYYHSVNWHKETHFLDMTQPTDHQQIIDFLKEADIVISNFRAGSAKKLGLDFETLSKLNPRLIYATISAYGEDDPRPGFDVVVQAETGWMFMNGEPGGPPVKMPVALMDILAAHQLKEGILLALLRRKETGKGSQVQVSLFDTGVASLANQAANWLNAKHLPQRLGSRHPNIAPYGNVFYAKDNKPLILSTGTERQFQNLCDALEMPGLKNDTRFLTNALRLAHRDELCEELRTAFAKFSAVEILQRCEANNTPIAPIRNMEELFQMPAAQRLVLEEILPDGTKSMRVKTAVFKLK